MLSKEEADDLLNPYKQPIAQAVVAGWDEYIQEYSAELRRKHTTRARANVVHDHIQHHIRAAFGSHPDARPYVRRNGFYLSIEGRVRLRFKKLDQDLRTRNIMTGNVFAFLHQVSIAGIPEPVTNLHAGYQLNDLETAVQGVFITCPMGGKNKWVIEIGPDTWGIPVAPIRPIPGSPTPHPPAGWVPLVRPRTSSEVDSGIDE